MRVFALGLLCSLASPLWSAEEGERLLRVTARRANVRSEPSLQSKAIGQLAAGATVRALEERGDWWRVSMPDGGEGFLHRSVVEPLAPAPPPIGGDPSPKSQAAAAPGSGAALSIDHRAIECIVAGRFTRIDARLEPSDRVARARAYFRAAGTPLWYYVDMKADSGAFVGVLPQAKTDTKGVEYYLQALDASFGESRTSEHAPRVVRGSAECSDKIVAAVLPTAKVVVGAPAGAPLVPVGFNDTGILAAAGASSPTPDSTGSSGGRSGKKLALIGGGAAAVAVVALAAGGGSDASTPAAAPPRPTFVNARFSPQSVTCSSTTARNGFFVANLLVDGNNPTSSPLGVSSASDILTFVAVAPEAGNSVGQSISQMGLRYTPDSIAAGAAATIQFQLPLGFQNSSRCRSFSGTSQLAAELTIVTSAGSFTVRSEAPLNLVYP